MHHPIVSVLMTSYNREKYIGEAIESVLSSTLTDFELIICDDGSKDATVDIARNYAKEDQRVKVYVNEMNLGDYPNRNQVASYAIGKYLKYVDADDRIYPWGLEILVNAMEDFPKAGFGLCSLPQDDEKPFPFQLSPSEAYRYHYFGPGIFHKAPLSSIIKREVFIKEGGFSTMRMVGDFEMWHRLGQKYPVVLLPHGIVWYRKHNEQESNFNRAYIKLYEEIKLRFINSPDSPLTSVERLQIIEKQRKSIGKDILKNLLRLNLTGFSDGLKKMGLYR